MLTVRTTIINKTREDEQSMVWYQKLVVTQHTIDIFWPCISMFLFSGQTSGLSLGCMLEALTHSRTNFLGINNFLGMPVFSNRICKTRKCTQTN